MFFTAKALNNESGFSIYLVISANMTPPLKPHCSQGDGVFFYVRLFLMLCINPDWSNLMGFFVYAGCLIDLHACRACLRGFSFKVIF